MPRGARVRSPVRGCGGPFWAPSQGAGPACVSQLCSVDTATQNGVTHVLERKRVSGHGATWRRCPGPRAQLERPASWRCETDKGPMLRARALTSSHAVPHEYLLSVERSCFLMGWTDAARADSEEGLAPPRGPRAGMAPGHSASCGPPCTRAGFRFPDITGSRTLRGDGRREAALPSTAGRSGEEEKQRGARMALGVWGACGRRPLGGDTCRQVPGSGTSSGRWAVALAAPLAAPLSRFPALEVDVFQREEERVARADPD